MIPRMAPTRQLDHDQVAADYVNRLDLTIDALARSHGCTPATIGRIIRRRGLSNTVRSAHRYDHDAIAADYVGGELTVAEIARKHGCNQTTVFDIARSRGLRRHAVSIARHESGRASS